MSNINVNNITPLAGTSGTVSVSGSLLVSGSITANGNIVLGDSTADSVSLGAEVSSSIIPDANNSYNLGSTAKTWKTIFASTASIGLVSSSLIPDADGAYDLGSSTKEYKDLYVDGVANIDTLGAATDGVGVAYINILSSSNSDMAGGGISCSVALIPSTDNKYDLGSSTLEWKDLYVDGVAYIDSFDAINSTGNSVLGNAASDTHTITGNITSSGNISGSTSVNTITLTATSLGGTLTTAAQTNITSVGTLSSLAVGNVTSTGNITAISSSNVFLSASSGIYGTLLTAAQSNITSVGILTIVSSSGNSVLGDALSDTHTITGNVTASNNIEAAGTISASNFVASGGTSTFLGITATGNSALGNAITDTHTISGHITASGAINASGSISASGDIIGDELRLRSKKIYEYSNHPTSLHDFDDDILRLTIGSANEFSGSLKISASSQNPGFLDVVGDITSSGNITASGTIQANSGITAGGSLNIGGGTILGNAVTDTHLLTGNVTASGNLSGSGDALFAEGTGTFKSGSIGNLTVSDALFVAQDIIHNGDTDTKITLAADDLTVTVGNEQMIKITEDGSQDKIVFGDGGDVDYEFSGTGQFKFTTDNTDHSIQQHDGNEVARIHDGGATQSDTDMTSVGYGFGFKHPVLAVTADSGDATITLSADDSGTIIQCDADTNNITFNLPAIDAANKAGLTYTFVNTTAVNGSKTVTVKTSNAGGDDADKFLMYGFNGATSISDVSGDVLTIPNSAAIGTVVRITCLASGGSNAAEIWLAEVFGASAVTNTAS
jgi:hypothetical protein